MEKVENVINELRTKINDCRIGMYYVKDMHSGEELNSLSREQLFSEGVKEGMYCGLEMALGLLEIIEEKYLEG